MKCLGPQKADKLLAWPHGDVFVAFYTSSINGDTNTRTKENRNS